MKPHHIILLTIATLLLFSCSKWTSVEGAKVQVENPWEANPALWAKYKTQLRDYKARPHTLVYGTFENNPAKGATSEKAYLRCLPDSLDIVSLKNELSDFDAQDLEWMRSVGTKVLCRVDLDGCKGDQTKMDAAINYALKTVSDLSLDGYSFTSSTSSTSAAAAKLIASKAEGKLLVGEGLPYFVEDLSAVDLWVLSTAEIENDLALNALVSDALYEGLERSSLVLTATFDGVFYDKNKKELSSREAYCDRVLSGDFAGISIGDIQSDYYHSDGNYLTLRSIIQRLNPSK